MHDENSEFIKENKRDYVLHSIIKQSLFYQNVSKITTISCILIFHNIYFIYIKQNCIMLHIENKILIIRLESLLGLYYL